MALRMGSLLPNDIYPTDTCRKRKLLCPSHYIYSKSCMNIVAWKIKQHNKCTAILEKVTYEDLPKTKPQVSELNKFQFWNWTDSILNKVCTLKARHSDTDP